MAAEQRELLPVHELLTQLREFQADDSASRQEALRASFAGVVTAYGARGAALHAMLPPLRPVELTVGTIAGQALIVRKLGIAGAQQADVTLTVDGDGDAADRIADAVAVALTATWSEQSTSVQRRQLEALDLAVRGIASIGPVEQVLQLIVDRVRELVGAQYAALGIVGSFGQIEQFITSGIAPELRTLIGPPPRGHGILGLIIQEDRSFLIDDIASDPRRYGVPPHHPEMHSFLGVPVHSRGRSIGNLYLTNRVVGGSFTEDDLALVERFAMHAGIAIENARLHEEIGRLAIVEERQRISQDLHDSIIQSLYAISLSLEDLPEVIVDDPAEGAARADRAIDSIHATIRDIRNFIMGLQPELLNQADLETGLRTLAAEFETNTLIDLEVRLTALTFEPAPEVSSQLLAITREGLSNVARHSGATRAQLALTNSNGSIDLLISDNGRGFDVNAPRTNRQRGLTNLRSRAEAVGGVLELASSPGAGTRLKLHVPGEPSR